MISSHITSSRKGFSILVALSTTGLLLIIALGIANVYISEMKLSRLHYDNILTYAQAEWAFEYAMLKIVNHREWFSDSVWNNDNDWKMLIGSTDRTKNIETDYSIESQSSEKVFSLEAGKHLILPLFVWESPLLSGKSRHPEYSRDITLPKVLTLSNADENISWSIVAMSGSENISIAGTGNISTATEWIIRQQSTECYDLNGNKINCVWGSIAENLDYFYDRNMKISDFLSSGITDPYLMIFNNWNISGNINIKTDSPFALPDTSVIAESRKGNALQSIRFYKDNSGYYDALKYGVYDTAQ